MKCSTCDAFVPDDSVFCLECGGRVVETATMNTSEHQTTNTSSAGIPTMRVFDGATSTPQKSVHSESVDFSTHAATQTPQPYMPPPPPSANMSLPYRVSNYTNTTAPTSNLAIVSLILGIMSWTILPIISAFIAIITGHMARREIRHSSGALTGDTMAIAGLVLGYIQLTATAFIFCLSIALFFNYFSVSP